MPDQRFDAYDALPSASPALDLSRDPLTFHDTILPSLRGLAATAHALSLTMRHDALSGEQAGDALWLLADHLDTATDLLHRWGDLHATS